MDSNLVFTLGVYWGSIACGKGGSIARGKGGVFDLECDSKFALPQTLVGNCRVNSTTSLNIDIWGIMQNMMLQARLRRIFR